MRRNRGTEWSFVAIAGNEPVAGTREASERSKAMKRITRTMIRAALPHLCPDAQRTVPEILNKCVPCCGVSYTTFKQLVRQWNHGKAHNWELDLYAVMGLFITDEQKTQLEKEFGAWGLDLCLCGRGYRLRQSAKFIAIIEEPFV